VVRHEHETIVIMNGEFHLVGKIVVLSRSPLRDSYPIRLKEGPEDPEVN
jgi:hypothetical protein